MLAALLDAGYTEQDIGMLENAGVPEEELQRIWVPGELQSDTRSYLAEAYDATYYVNDILAENTEVLTLSSRYFGDTSYTYGAQRLSSDNTSGTRQAYTYDGRGSVVQVLERLAAVNTCSYTDYGAPSVSAPNPYAAFYGFNGEEHDPLTGLQYLRARYYDTETGSFISQDPYAGTLQNPLSQNRYTYAENNPINYADPSGYSVWSSAKGVAGSVTSTLKKVVAPKTITNSVTGPSVASTVSSRVGGSAQKLPAAWGAAAVQNSVLAASSHAPAQNRIYTPLSSTLVPSCFDAPAAAAAEYIAARGCDSSLKKVSQQKESGWNSFWNEAGNWISNAAADANKWLEKNGETITKVLLGASAIIVGAAAVVIAIGSAGTAVPVLASVLLSYVGSYAATTLVETGLAALATAGIASAATGAAQVASM